MTTVVIPLDLNLVQGLSASKRSRTYLTEGLGSVTQGTPPSPLFLTCPPCQRTLPLFWQTAQKYKWFALCLYCQLRYESTRTQRSPASKELTLNFTSSSYLPPPIEPPAESPKRNFQLLPLLNLLPLPQPSLPHVLPDFLPLPGPLTGFSLVLPSPPLEEEFERVPPSLPAGLITPPSLLAQLTQKIPREHIWKFLVLIAIVFDASSEDRKNPAVYPPAFNQDPILLPSNTPDEIRVKLGKIHSAIGLSSSYPLSKKERGQWTRQIECLRLRHWVYGVMGIDSLDQTLKLDSSSPDPLTIVMDSSAIAYLDMLRALTSPCILYPRSWQCPVCPPNHPEAVVLADHLNACKTQFRIEWLDPYDRACHTIPSLRKRFGFGWGSIVEDRRRFLIREMGRLLGTFGVPIRSR